MTRDPSTCSPLVLCVGARPTLAQLDASLVRRCRYTNRETAPEALALLNGGDEVGVVVAELGAAPLVDRDALVAMTETSPQALLIALQGRGASERAPLSVELFFRQLPWPCPRQHVVQAVLEGLAYHRMRRRAMTLALPRQRDATPELLRHAATELLRQGRRSEAERSSRPFLGALLRHCQAGSLPLLGDVRLAIDLALQLAASDGAEEWIRYVFDLHSTLRLAAAHDVLERLSRIVAGLPHPSSPTRSRRS